MCVMIPIVSQEAVKASLPVPYKQVNDTLCLSVLVMRG